MLCFSFLDVLDIVHTVLLIIYAERTYKIIDCQKLQSRSDCRVSKYEYIKLSFIFFPGWWMVHQNASAPPAGQGTDVTCVKIPTRLYLSLKIQVSLKIQIRTKPSCSMSVLPTSKSLSSS